MKNFAQLNEDIKDLLDTGWTPNNKKNGLTFSPRHRKVSEALTQEYGTPIILQLWIHRVVAPDQLDLELTGQFEGRGHLTSELRKLLANKEQDPPFEEPDGETIIIRLPLHGNHQEQTGQIRAFIEYVSAKLRDYDLPSATTSTSSSSRSSAIDRMITNANNAANQSGSESVTIKKHKKVRFESDEAFKDYVQELIDQQQGHCKLSGLPFINDSDEAKSDYHMSLDRIDSDGHYKAGNLQIVCRFINRWKSDSDNEAFKILLETVRTAPPSRPSFESIFFKDKLAVQVSVPDYQRAFSWEKKQIELFISDLVKYLGARSYYFGHFIVEATKSHNESTETDERKWEVVDGQQRLTILVLFLMVCRHMDDSCAEISACSLIKRFSTVSYDRDALAHIDQNLAIYLESNSEFNPKNPPTDLQIMEGFGITKDFTQSQRRMVLALLHFQHAFKKGELDRNQISGYVEVVMQAHCSCHVTDDKAVAVNIFEMHNTRGVPLSTMEILKAKLMQFVYSKGGEERDQKVHEIQGEFGQIYAMEERLRTKGFRGEMTMDNLLRQHLRVVDDGNKATDKEFQSPPTNSNAEELIKYVDDKLNTANLDYALDLAIELRKSMQIMTEVLPNWDTDETLVGDVMILERELSCEWFLLICRRLASTPEKIDGRISTKLLSCWEKLLFTRDFHNKYHGLWYKDDFPKLFAELGKNEEQISGLVERYIKDGFRSGYTDELQTVVRTYIKENESNILNNAFYWWKSKMIYALYKYEAHLHSNIRNVMKGTVSVEHILPQEWDWEWTNATTDQDKEALLKKMGNCINGIGNLLLITPGENSSVGNDHPADKRYHRYCAGGSYKVHHENCEEWRSSENWEDLIGNRGKTIYQFILDELIDAPMPPLKVNLEEHA
jgi:hypothetical protein